ncbi:alpha/beta-type small acid-soluble spore protein [Paenibacillus xylanilyticus]|uniref:alpha/beta-type small acid-soluble spore protein n=1 Tax=Paenibacillus xylanilyticus TaxID=248903 RepID=UPI00129E8756|nr:alpha/beta-type small acid-soluble spore protein [Paenibacillus xylanilyticus]
MARSNRRVVPESRQMLDQMKYEIAAEFGLNVGYAQNALAGADTEFGSELGAVSDHSYGQYKGWGHLTSRENGSVGGEITKRLIRQAEKQLL